MAPEAEQRLAPIGLSLRLIRTYALDFFSILAVGNVWPTATVLGSLAA
jgi:hypothetical protein